MPEGTLWVAQVAPPSVVTTTTPTVSLGSAPTAQQSEVPRHDTAANDPAELGTLCCIQLTVRAETEAVPTRTAPKVRLDSAITTQAGTTNRRWPPLTQLSAQPTRTDHPFTPPRPPSKCPGGGPEQDSPGHCVNFRPCVSCCQGRTGRLRT